MFSSVGITAPRGPFAGAAPLAPRPLSAIAATTAGGVPQKRIQRVLAELLQPLAPLHEHGRVWGDISVHSVGMDENGRAHLLALAGPAPAGDPTAFTPGYAPFELYPEAAEWPRGPWTDIYALSAVAYALITGQRPPAASDRCVNETYRPLVTQHLPHYDAAFLAAIDTGMSFRPADRPQTLEAFASLLSLPAASAAIVPARESVAPGSPTYETDVFHGPRRNPVRSALKILLLALATAGVSAYWWGRLTERPNPVITYSEPASARAAGATADAAPELTADVKPEETPPLPPAVVPPETPTAVAPAPAEVATGSQDEARTPPIIKEPARAEATAPPPAPVRVSINVRPWGEIIVNGVSRGITPPLKNLSLLPGKYTVTIRNSAQPAHRMSLEVRAGKPAVITHDFR